jgi:hypothetical protein
MSGDVTGSVRILPSLDPGASGKSHKVCVRTTTKSLRVSLATTRIRYCADAMREQQRRSAGQYRSGRIRDAVAEGAGA